MRAEQLLYAIGDIRDGFIREAVPESTAPRRGKHRWAILAAACLCLVILIARVRPAAPAPGDDAAPGAAPPADSEASAPDSAVSEDDRAPSDPGCDNGRSIEVDGVTYVISSAFQPLPECPEGFAYAGETAAGDSALHPYYTSPEHPEWVYVYQECYDRQTQEPYMAYVRYVEAVLQGLTLIQYQGTVYVYLNDTYYLPYQTEVPPKDQARYDAVPYDSVIRELPEGFEPVGKTVFDGYDAVPTSELGINRSWPGQQVLANSTQPDILLLRHYWSGLEGPDYWVFVRYQDLKMGRRLAPPAHSLISSPGAFRPPR